MEKQTAVQWLIETITLGLSEKGMKTAFDKALEMEKEQIKDAYESLEHRHGENYYNETYKTKTN
jgi:uncharacterized membrane protein